MGKLSLTVKLTCLAAIKIFRVANLCRTCDIVCVKNKFLKMASVDTSPIVLIVTVSSTVLYNFQEKLAVKLLTLYI